MGKGGLPGRLAESQRPEDGDDEDGHDEEPHQHWKPETCVVSEAVARRAHDHQVGRRCHRRQECPAAATPTLINTGSRPRPSRWQRTVRWAERSAPWPYC